MKKNFTLLLFAIAGTAIYAQPNLNNQVIVYFKQGQPGWRRTIPLQILAL